MKITEGRIATETLEFAYLSAGEGPLALCLHGFPDTAWAYRHLLIDLAEAGFRAVAPFMRGYSPTEIPSDGVYQTGALSADACALHEALGGDESAVIIGHDWGAPAAYGAANYEPQRWRKVVGAAVPPGGGLGAAFFDYTQVKRSWYMFFFQHALSDLVVPHNDMAFIDGLWSDWSPGFDGTEDIAKVKEALSDPANLAAALGYYRATLGDGPRSETYAAAQSAGGTIPGQPLLYLHGENDGCVGLEVAEGAKAELNVSGSSFEVIRNAGHFMLVEQPQVANKLIIDFLTAS